MAVEISSPVRLNLLTYPSSTVCSCRLMELCMDFIPLTQDVRKGINIILSDIDQNNKRKIQSKVWKFFKCHQFPNIYALESKLLCFNKNYSEVRKLSTKIWKYLYHWQQEIMNIHGYQKYTACYYHNLKCSDHLTVFQVENCAICNGTCKYGVRMSET